jgi:hypothetical protein
LKEKAMNTKFFTALRKKVLDFSTFGQYNRRSNKQTFGRKNMADSVNYTAEMVSSMTDQYEAEPTMATVEALASQFSKPKRSIISKLSNLGIYVPASKGKTKSGAPVVRKDELVEQIQDALGTNLSLPSLGKATKSDLLTLLAIVETNAEAD